MSMSKQQLALLQPTHHALHPEEAADAVPARDGRDLVHGAAGVEDQIARGQLDALFAQGLAMTSSPPS